MTQDILAEAFEKLLQDNCAPQVVRAAEEGGDVTPLWTEFARSGFLDALVPEDAGGAGLGLGDVAGLVTAAGYHAVPLPFAQTLFARAVLAAAGQAAPDGPVTLATGRAAEGVVQCPRVPGGLVAKWVLVGLGTAARLLPVDGAEVRPTGVRGSLDAAMAWAAPPADAVEIGAGGDLEAAGAALHAGLMAGAMGRVLETTLDYAGQRNQFGRAIARFQAVQQQLSVMAEEAFAARMAARLALSGAGFRPDRLLAAMAKARTGEAAARVAAVAHAVHGAIGVTEELDLQLFTRRLHEWRAAHGGEGYWNGVVGRALLEAGDTSALDFVRGRMAAAG